MENLPKIHPATGQEQGHADDVSLKITSPIDDAELSSALSSPLSGVLLEIGNRGMSGREMPLLIHSVNQNELELYHLRKTNKILQVKYDNLLTEVHALSKNLAVTNERMGNRVGQNLIKAIFTVLGGAVAGFGIDIYKNESVTSNGLILIFIGAAVLIVNELFSVFQGLKK